MPKAKTSPPSPDDALLLRAGQTARILLVDPTTLNLLIARGDLPVVRLTPAGHRLFDYDEVRALRRRREKQAQRVEKRKAETPHA